MPTKITIPAAEMYDSKTQMFSDEPEITFEVEHSLVSLSKWEALTNKAFLGPAEKTTDEVYLYIQCMVLGDAEVPMSSIRRIPRAEFEKIHAYIDKSQTASWFSEIPGQPQRRNREIPTAELIYHWMIAMAVPVEKFETWHLGRLFVQLKMINEKNKKPTKMTKAEVMAKHRATMEKNRKLAAEGLL